MAPPIEALRNAPRSGPYFASSGVEHEGRSKHSAWFDAADAAQADKIIRVARGDIDSIEVELPCRIRFEYDSHGIKPNRGLRPTGYWVVGPVPRSLPNSESTPQAQSQETNEPN